MLPMEERILFCNSRGSLYVETYSTVQKLAFDGTDTNILRMCVHVLLKLCH